MGTTTVVGLFTYTGSGVSCFGLRFGFNNGVLVYGRLSRLNGDNGGIGLSILPVCVRQFLSNEELLLRIFQPLFFRETVVKVLQYNVDDNI